MPRFHCARTSIQESRLNSKSWPEGLPRKKNGTITAKLTAATTNSGRGKKGTGADSNEEFPLGACEFRVRISEGTLPDLQCTAIVMGSANELVALLPSRQEMRVGLPSRWESRGILLQEKGGARAPLLGLSAPRLTANGQHRALGVADDLISDRPRQV